MLVRVAGFWLRLSVMRSIRARVFASVDILLVLRDGDGAGGERCAWTPSFTWAA